MNFSSNLPFNWFDIFVVVMLLAGYSRGRKNGMSQEIVPFFKWIALVIICAMTYRPVGTVLSQFLKVSELVGYMLAYSLMAIVVALGFVALHRTVGERLKGSDRFGKGEFYLAMPAGMVRFACITLALLALLNARLYSTAEVQAMEKYQNDNYGSNFFPTVAGIQDDVFVGSFIGKQVKAHLGHLLIEPTPGNPSPLFSSSIKRREWELE